LILELKLALIGSRMVEIALEGRKFELFSLKHNGYVFWLFCSYNITQCDLSHVVCTELDLSHASATERDLSHVEVVWVFSMGMSKSFWEKSNFQEIFSNFFLQDIFGAYTFDTHFR